MMISLRISKQNQKELNSMVVQVQKKMHESEEKTVMMEKAISEMNGIMIKIISLLEQNES